MTDVSICSNAIPPEGGLNLNILLLDSSFSDCTESDIFLGCFLPFPLSIALKVGAAWGLEV